MADVRYDMEYIQALLARKIKPELEAVNGEVVFPRSAQEIIRNLDTSSILYVSTHKSHLDYAMICSHLAIEELPYPCTLTGENLLTGAIGWAIKKWAGIDYEKSGAVKIARQKTKSVGPGVFKELISLFLEDNPVLAFPEESEKIDRDGNKVIKTGRSYTGQIHGFSNLIFGAFAKAARQIDHPSYIVPITVSYDFVPEDLLYSRLIEIEAMRNSKSPITRGRGNAAYVAVEGSFLGNMFKHCLGDIYIDVGEPILVTGAEHGKDLSARTQAECERSYRVTPVALVSRAILNQQLRESPDYSLSGLANAVVPDLRILHEHNANIVTPGDDLEMWVGKALISMEYRGILSAKALSSGHLELTLPDVVKYYANTIAHHWRIAS